MYSVGDQVELIRDIAIVNTNGGESIFTLGCQSLGNDYL